MADEKFAVPGDMPDFVREAEEMVSHDEVLPEQKIGRASCRERV